MRQTLPFLFLFFFSNIGFGQLFHEEGGEHSFEIDSLQNEFETNLELGNKKIAAETLRKIATKYLYTRRFDEAIAAYEKQMTFAKKHNIDNEYLDGAGAVVEMMIMRGQFKEAKNILCDIVEHPLIRQNDFEKSRILVKLGCVYSELGSLDSAKVFLDEGVRLKIEVKDTFGLFLPYNYFSIFYQKIGEWDAALDYQFKAIAIKEQQNDSITLPMLVKVVSDIFIKQKDWEKAEKYALIALEDAEKQNLRLAKSGLYENLSKININKGNDEVAAKYLEQAIEIQKSTSNFHFVDNLLDLAKIRMKKRQYEPILELISEAYHRSLESGDQTRLSKSEKVTGDYYAHQNLNSEALLWYEKAMVRADSFKLKPSILAVSQALSNIYEKENDPQRALFYHKKYSSVKDSIFNKNQQTLVHELETKYQLKEKETAISALNAQNELKDLKLHEAQRQKIAFLLALLGLALLAASGFYLFKIKRDSNEKLAEKNEIISAALEEKGILLREIHHRVKNNLQVISSILKLQSIHLSDEKALAALNEGRNRVQSMSLIHQNLYRDDNVTSIEAADYIKKLTETLFNSYNVAPEQVKLKTNVQSIMMDVDTAIPVGLILNELISNALKHAFAKTESGELTVDLSESFEGLRLIVSDNGSGFDQSEIAERRKNSFGMELVELLSEKLEATMNVVNENGTTVDLLIKNYKIA